MKNFQKIALERIYRLFELARLEFLKHPERSRRYVHLSRMLCTKNRVKIPKELRTSFCKKCGSFLVEGANSKITSKDSMLIVECHECGYKRKMKA